MPGKVWYGIVLQGIFPGCSDGARAAVTVGGLALLLQVLVLIVN